MNHTDSNYSADQAKDETIARLTKELEAEKLFNGYIKEGATHAAWQRDFRELLKVRHELEKRTKELEEERKNTVANNSAMIELIIQRDDLKAKLAVAMKAVEFVRGLSIIQLYVYNKNKLLLALQSELRETFDKQKVKIGQPLD